MEITREDIAAGLRRLGLDKSSAVIAHSSLKSFGRVDGGPQAVVGALREVCGTVLVPTFTWDSLYYPDGWERNPNCPAVLSPEEVEAANQRAIPYDPAQPTSRSIGIIPDTLLRQPDARVSGHPIHRYAAIGPHAEKLVASQTPDRPLAPIAELRELGGSVLLLGVGHDRNTSIHLAEREAGRRQWTYWALVKDRGVVECTNHPGCSAEFNSIEPLVREITRETMIGQCRARLLPVRELIERVKALLREDPRALLCDKCRRCRMIAKELG